MDEDLSTPPTRHRRTGPRLRRPVAGLHNRGGTMKYAVLTLYRIRTPLFMIAVYVFIAVVILDLVPLHSVDLVPAIHFCRASLLVISILVLLLCVCGPRLLTEHPATTVQSPVAGRWLGVNSPATNVPSHGIRGYGQTYAIDVVAEPEDGSPRPAYGGTVFRDPRTYPAFGEPVLAMVDGTVVSATHRHRDHRARSNPAGLIYLMFEGMIRELGGPGFIVGNHVTIRTGDGVFATVAHLQRGSVNVAVGDRVHAGDQVGRCGNSGNSSEPHVHAQLMDRASLWTAQGLPIAFNGVRLGEDAGPVDGLPENGQHMTTTHPER
ncbi:MAG: M23 family metallopeptidase [Mycobacteriaceae bacterium]